jgi:hypothetical protein
MKGGSMVDKAEEGGQAPPPIGDTLDVSPEAEAEVEALAGALPDWDLVPEAPFLRRR